MSSAAEPSLDELVRSYYRRDWERFPTHGSSAGLRAYDHRLEVPTRDLLEEGRRDCLEALRSLESLGPSIQASLDGKAFWARLVRERLDDEQIQGWRTNPVQPVNHLVESIFDLLMRRDPLAADTTAAVAARLARFPDYLGAVRQRISDPVGMWIEPAVSAAQGGIAFLAEAIPPLAVAQPRLAAEVNSALAIAQDALSGYTDWLRGLDRAVLADDPAVGEAALGTIVREIHGLPLALDAIDATATREIERYQAELAEAAGQIDRRRSWVEILDDHRKRFAADHRDLIEDYRQITFGLRDRLVAEGVLDLPPGESCAVVSTPAFLRSVIPTAAYSAPGPLDSVQRGIFFVSDPPASLPPEPFRANLGQHLGWELTCAHEAYPGHHVQLCWANRARSLALQMAHHIIFMEGWTLYCEQLLIELGWYPDPVFRLMYLVDQLWRALRIRIDVRVHSRRMTVPAAVDLLQAVAGFTPLRAQTELNWYTQSPGTPMSYLLGKAETLRLRQRFTRGGPRSLRDFHTWLLGFGSVPQHWLEDYLP